MKIIEAITQADEIKPNDFGQAEKVRWLSELDHKINEEIIKRHEGFEDVSFSGYNDETALDSVDLLADDAYAELYVSWLCAKIDFHNAEIGKYNNQITDFNTLYRAFERWYNRTHKPLNTAMRYF